MTRKLDLSGERFGKLVALKSAPNGKWGKSRWVCICDCGKEHNVSTDALRKGFTKSCGCYRTSMHLLPGDLGSFNTAYGQYRCNARTRGHSFSLSMEEFRNVSSKPCKYCGADPKPYYAKNRVVVDPIPYLCNGIDRVNNEVGYEISNCVPCCDLCNYMKRSMFVDDFVRHVKKIASYLG
jgi:hypothetical protein